MGLVHGSESTSKFRSKRSSAYGNSLVLSMEPVAIHFVIFSTADDGETEAMIRWHLVAPSQETGTHSGS